MSFESQKIITIIGPLTPRHRRMNRTGLIPAVEDDGPRWGAFSAATPPPMRPGVGIRCAIP